MKRALLLMTIAGLASACASASSSRVRDIDGNPLPPYAFARATEPVLKVRCADGRGYLVIRNPPPYMYGARYGQIIRLVQRNEAGVCDRILASRM
jgi:hypothetical protein